MCFSSPFYFFLTFFYFSLETPILRFQFDYFVCQIDQLVFLSSFFLYCQNLMPFNLEERLNELLLMSQSGKCRLSETKILKKWFSQHSLHKLTITFLTEWRWFSKLRKFTNSGDAFITTKAAANSAPFFSPRKFIITDLTQISGHDTWASSGFDFHIFQYLLIQWPFLFYIKFPFLEGSQIFLITMFFVFQVIYECIDFLFRRRWQVLFYTLTRSHSVINKHSLIKLYLQQCQSEHYFIQYNIFNMNNDSNLSSFSSSSILAITPHNYDFQAKFPEQFLSTRFNKSMPVKVGKFRQQITWKPKIPSKKLFQEPKFLLSMERKKVRVINGLRDSDFEAPEIQRNQFKSERIKIRREGFSKNRRQLYEDINREDSYMHSNLIKTQKNRKIPLVNFNLQHLIKQRKSFKSQDGARKKGNNDPYYSFASSNRFQMQSRQSELQDSVVSRQKIRTAKFSRLPHKC